MLELKNITFKVDNLDGKGEITILDNVSFRVNKEDKIAFVGNEIAIKLFKKDEEGKKEYQGILKKYTEQDIIIEDNENKQKQINRKNISQIKTVYNWE